MKQSIYIVLISLGFLLSSCDLTQEVTIDLPDYESEIVVESYLQPGLPFSVLLTQSVSFFDELQLIYVEGATVTIAYGNQVDTLTELTIALNTPGLELLLDTALLNDFQNFLGDGITIYGSLAPVPALYETPFTLKVTTEDGEELSATTVIPSPITFEEPVIRFDDENERALLLTQFQDDGNRRNFYRRLLEKREEQITENEDGTTDTTWVSDELQDFLVDDEINNGDLQTFGTAFDFVRGDTVIQTIYSITQEYFDFVTTRDAALGASLSPFGQPAQLRTNIQGGNGIFTGQSRSELVTIIE